MTIPFDDQVGTRSESIISNGKDKKKGSVSSVDTIPLLAKSAGLRTDTMIANATIIDNLDSGQQTMTENGVGDRSPPTSPIETKLHILGNGHRTEFISTIST